MAAMDWFWRTEEVRAASAARQYGWIVRTARELRGETLEQVADRCCMSKASLSRLETGTRSLRDVVVLTLLADQLAIPHHVLGVAPPPGAAPRRPTPPAATVGATTADDRSDIVRRRHFLAGLAGLAGAGMLPGVASAHSEAHLDDLLLADRAPAAPISLDRLTGLIDDARAAFAACRYTDLDSALPRLTSVAHATHAAARGDQRREHAASALAQTYLVGAEVAIKTARPTLAAVAADRALAYARDGGDALTVAAGTRQVAIALRHETLTEPGLADRAAGLSQAVRLLTGTALDLGADRGTPTDPELAAYGSLLCTAAYSAAQLGHAAEAVGLLEEAENAATRATPAAVPALSRETVAVYRVSVHTKLGDTSSALAHARGIDPARLPTTERRMRLAVDTARAHRHDGNTRAAAQSLLQLADIAPDELRRPAVRAMITDMTAEPGPTSRELAQLTRALG